MYVIVQGSIQVRVRYVSTVQLSRLKSKSHCVAGQVFESRALNTTFEYQAVTQFVYHGAPLENCTVSSLGSMDIIGPPALYPRWSFNQTGKFSLYAKLFTPHLQRCFKKINNNSLTLFQCQSSNNDPIKFVMKGLLYYGFITDTRAGIVDDAATMVRDHIKSNNRQMCQYIVSKSEQPLLSYRL